MTVDPSYEGDNEQNALACSDLRQAASGMSEESAAAVSVRPSPHTWGGVDGARVLK